MKNKQLLGKIDSFFKLAESEKVPEKSDDESVILKTLSKLETFKARVEYAEKCLKHLSSGSSRVIYVMPGGDVLKLAKNDRGVDQNLVESKVKSKYVNKTIKSDPHGVWKISPFLDKITEKEFESMVGCSFKDFGEAISYALKGISGSDDRKKPKDYEKIEKLEIFKDLVITAKKYDLMPGDLVRISSYGKVDGHPTILDAGLTKEIYDEYY